METKPLNKKQYNFLQKEMDYCFENEVVTQEQKETILSLYSIKEKLSFTTVISVVGAILVGLGVLLFIASNWGSIGKFWKFEIIVSAFVGVNIASYFLSDNYSKTSRSLNYIGVLIYGAGLFLIGQAFNLGGHFTRAFLWWAIGILPMAVIMKDKAIYVFSTVCAMAYLNGYFTLGKDVPYAIFALIPAFYYLNKYYGYSRLLTFFNNLILLNTVLFFEIYAEMDFTFGVLIFLAIGLIMYFAPINFNKEIFKLQGNLAFGIAGFILTFTESWSDFVKLFWPNNGYYFANGDYCRIASIAFAVLFILFLLLLTRKGNILALVFICAVILKFYFDLTYSFHYRSLVFIIGGLLFLGLGFMIERTRRRLGGINYEG